MMIKSEQLACKSELLFRDRTFDCLILSSIFVLKIYHYLSLMRLRKYETRTITLSGCVVRKHFNEDNLENRYLPRQMILAVNIRSIPMIDRSVLNEHLLVLCNSENMKAFFSEQRPKHWSFFWSFSLWTTAAEGGKHDTTFAQCVDDSFRVGQRCFLSFHYSQHFSLADRNTFSVPLLPICNCSGARHCFLLLV